MSHCVAFGFEKVQSDKGEFVWREEATFKCCLLQLLLSSDFMFDCLKEDIGVLVLVGNSRLTINSFDAGSDEIPSGLRRRDCCYPSPTVGSGPRCKDTGHWAPTKIQAAF